MQFVPLKDVPQGSLRESTLDQPVIDPHGDFMLGVPRVKVRRLVVTVVDRDHDPEEATDLRPALMIQRLPAAQITESCVGTLWAGAVLSGTNFRGFDGYAERRT